jgi:L-lactate dehydrogenase complex protein LldG
VDAKAEILSRIAGARVTASGTFVRPPAAASTRPHAEVVEQFAEYAAEYKAHVVRVSEAELPEAILTALTARASARAVIPADLPREWLPEGPAFVTDEALPHRALDDVQAVVTGCAVAVAETGTVVLDAGPGQGRRAITLIPDHHVCVVRESQVVESVPEAVAMLRDSALAGRPLTWISGPSATSDIELQRVEGVHGPRILDILIVM